MSSILYTGTFYVRKHCEQVYLDSRHATLPILINLSTADSIQLGSLKIIIVHGSVTTNVVVTTKAIGEKIYKQILSALTNTDESDL